jgi:hypothetical protein
MEQILELFSETQKNILSYLLLDDIENLSKEPDLFLKFPKAFEIACQNDSINIVKFFWRLGVPMDMSFLPLLCVQGQYNLVKFLMTNYSIKNIDWISLVVCACKSGNIQLVKYLLHLGFEYSNCTAICTAACQGHVEIVKLLLSLGADMYCNNNFIFRVACEKGYVGILQLLKQTGFNYNNDQSVGLSLAAMNGKNECIEFLSLNEVDIKSDNHAAFYFAVKGDKAETLQFLIRLINEDIDYKILLQFVEKVKETTNLYPVKCGFIVKNKLKIDDFPLDIVTSNECPVCFKGGNIILSCRHNICVECYFSLKFKTCPVCRYEIDEKLIKKKI